MRFFVLSIIFVLQMQHVSAVKSISPMELHELLKSGDVELIDVRNTEEYLEEHIDGAKNIPLQILDKTQIGSTVVKIVVQCKSGKRGEKAYHVLKSIYSDADIYNLKGGISEWKERGFNTIVGRNISITRQTQIVAGSLVFAGTIAAIFINPYFLAIPICIGCGLMFAGISGWCGLGELLSLAKWNN